MSRRRIVMMAGAAIGACCVLGGVLWWFWPGGPRNAPTTGSAGGEAEAATQPVLNGHADLPQVRLFTRLGVKKQLAGSTFVGTDSRMYSSYDTDGDGQYDCDEIRQYGTLMYGPMTRSGAKTIEYVLVPNPDDLDADGLPDDWEQGYFGKLDYGRNDDPDGDGFPKDS